MKPENKKEKRRTYLILGLMPLAGPIPQPHTGQCYARHSHVPDMWALMLANQTATQSFSVPLPRGSSLSGHHLYRNRTLCVHLCSPEISTSRVTTTASNLTPGYLTNASMPSAPCPESPTTIAGEGVAVMEGGEAARR